MMIKKTSWFTLTLLILISMVLVTHLNTLIWAENTYAVCGVQCEELNALKNEVMEKSKLTIFCNDAMGTLWQCG